MAYTLRQHQRQMAATRRAIAKREKKRAAEERRYRAARDQVNAAHDRMEEQGRRYGTDSPAYRLAYKRWMRAGSNLAKRFRLL